MAVFSLWVIETRYFPGGTPRPSGPGTRKVPSVGSTSAAYGSLAATVLPEPSLTSIANRVRPSRCQSGAVYLAPPLSSFPVTWTVWDDPQPETARGVTRKARTRMVRRIVGSVGSWGQGDQGRRRPVARGSR